MTDETASEYPKRRFSKTSFEVIIIPITTIRAVLTNNKETIASLFGEKRGPKTGTSGILKTGAYSEKSIRSNLRRKPKLSLCKTGSRYQHKVGITQFFANF